MAIVLHNGSSAGLFDRLGTLIGGILDVYSIMGGTATSNVASGASMKTRVNTLNTRYAASPAEQAIIDGIYSTLSSWQSSQSSLFTAFKNYATNTLINMANDDTALSSKTVAAAMALLITQMKSSSDTVNASAPAVGAQTNVASPTGNPIIIGSATDGDGKLLEYALPQTVTFTTTTDAQTGGATARRETLTATSGATISDTLNYLWPGGAGVNKTISLVDSKQSASSTGNMLSGGSTYGPFNVFTVANTPDQWVISTGAAGTGVLDAGTGNAYGGVKALQIKYVDGAELTGVTQQFNNSGGTTVTLKPDVVYAVNLFAKRDSGLTLGGTVRVSLIDGSNTIINDDAGTANSFTFTAAGLATTYAAKNGFFRLPSSLPTTVKIRVDLSVAIADSGKSVYIADLAMTPAVQLAAGEPYYAAFAGSTNTLKNDSWTSAVTNTWGSFQQWFERFFGMKSLGLKLPSNSAAGETIPDSYIA